MAFAFFALWIAWARKMRDEPMQLVCDRAWLDAWLLHRSDR